jgi:hypothetical protein
MTAARRPDGSGGPLARDERIDDIQFYVDPRASVLIDDMVLYEAGDESEKRPFPRRIHFTGWFDTGKQGQEWPGMFSIVEHEKPQSWKCAQAVKHKDVALNGVFLGLRGDRAPTPARELKLDFRYRLAGKSKTLAVMLATDEVVMPPKDAKAFREKIVLGEWGRATATFAPVGEELKQFDQLHFVADNESTLQIDDVLLYEE